MREKHLTATANETARHVRDSIRALIEDFKHELSRGANCNPVKVCEISRALSDEADHAFSHPEVWEGDIYEEALDLLRRAAEATAGTEPGINCARRPEEFQCRISSALAAKKALERIGC
jgi:hypothetical protein